MADLIIIRGTQDSGKTTTAGIVYQELLKFCDHKHQFNGKDVTTDSLLYNDTESTKDFIAILTCKGKKIGIVSAGDIAEELRKIFDKLIQLGVDIIVCCTRSINKKGSAYRLIEDEYRAKNTIVLVVRSEFSPNVNDRYSIKQKAVQDIVDKINEILGR